MTDSAPFPTPPQGLMRRVPGGGMVASTAMVTGDVDLGEDASIWFGCSVRGDDASIRIGARSNIQDNCVVHCDTGHAQVIGKDCTVGHGAILHGVEMGDRVLIGMGATILGGATIGDGAVIAAGALVREGFEVPPGMVVAGVPAKVIREVNEREAAFIKDSVPHYVEAARSYLAEDES